MALIVCPECGKQVSDMAESCPHCGYPISRYVAEQKSLAELAAKEKKRLDSVKAKATRKPLSRKAKIIVLICVIAFIIALVTGYIFGIKKPYEQACAVYSAVMEEYETVVDNYRSKANAISLVNDKLDAEIEKLDNLVYSEVAPYDIETKNTAINVISEAKAAKYDLPPLPPFRSSNSAPNFTAFQSKDILAEAETISLEMETITSTNDKLAVPEYNIVLSKIEDAYQLLNNSILQNFQVTNPSEAFILERLSGISGITTIEAVTEDNDPNGNLHKPGGYTSAVYFIHDQVTDTYVLYYKGDTPTERGTDGGGCIEVYETVEYAEARRDYLATFDGTITASGSHTVCGTVLVRTSNELTATQQLELESAIINALIELR